MRLVCFGDIHMAFRAIERVGPALRTADVAILTGDLTNFGEPDDAWRVVDAVRAHCPHGMGGHRQPRHAVGDRRAPGAGRLAAR